MDKDQLFDKDRGEQPLREEGSVVSLNKTKPYSSSGSASGVSSLKSNEALNNFVHLHVHTHYSLLKSSCTVPVW